MHMIRNLPEIEYRDGSHFGIHAIMDFAKYGPAYFHHKHILRSLEEDGDQKAFDIGRALHLLVLEGPERYMDEVAIRPEHYVDAKGVTKPWHHASNTCKEWLTNAESSGKTVVSSKDHNLVSDMDAAVNADSDALGLLTNGFAEAAFRHEVHGVPLQCRTDWIAGDASNPSTWKHIADLKSCADLNAFASGCWRYGYWWQAAFYRWMIEAYVFEHTGKKRDIPFYLVAVEKMGIHRVKCYELPEAAYLQANGGTHGWQATLSDIAECWNVDEWPTGVAPGIEMLDMPAWMESKEGALV